MRRPGRVVVAALAVALLIGSPALALTEWALGESRTRARAESIATAQRATVSGAAVVAARVLGVREALGSAAQGLLVQYGAARKDKAVLSGILADLRPLIGAAEDVQYVFVIDQGGALLAADPPAPELLAGGSDHAEWSARARDGRTAVSDVYASAFRGSPPAVIVSVPVRDGFGQPAGALAAAIDLSRASAWFAGLSAPGARIRLLDAGGAAIGPAGAEPGPSQVVATSRVEGLGWQVEVAQSGAAIEHELAPLALVSRSLAALLAVLVVIVAVALLTARSRLDARRSDAAVERDAVVTAGRQRVVFLDRFSQGLRTPLNSIVGFSGLLEEQLADTGFAVPERRWLRNIRAETAQLVSLTSDALDLSAVDSGDLELRPRVIDLGELMTPLRAAADAAARERDIVVLHDIGGGHVRLDVDRVRRIAGAIVDRAVRRAPAGAHIAVTASATGGFELVVVLTSTGLLAERVPAIREALSGLPDPSDEPGARLALAVAARMAALHGGSITYDERDARTGSFRVHIPDLRDSMEVA